MKRSFQALIFDLDGVLVDSTPVVERHWKRWAQKHDLNFEKVLKTAHGRRAVDTITKLRPSLDAKKEAEELALNESTDTQGLQIYEGAKSLLTSLPAGVWAIATSGTKRTAQTRLNFAELPVPNVLITAENVSHGKPDPEIYTLAASRLKAESERCIVVEDSPAGVKAAKKAGMYAVALSTTHDADQLKHADVILPTIAYLSFNHHNKMYFLTS